jgi:hypothetical protein
MNSPVENNKEVMTFALEGTERFTKDVRTEIARTFDEVKRVALLLWLSLLPSPVQLECVCGSVAFPPMESSPIRRRSLGIPGQRALFGRAAVDRKGPRVLQD